MSTAQARTEFENVSQGVIGAVVLGDDNRPKGIPVKPGDSIWLTEAEEILTANAPRRDEDNPFAKGWLVVKTQASDVINRRPIGSRSQVATPVEQVDEEVDEPPLDNGNDPVEPPREEKPATPDEVGSPPLPEGDPAHGVRPPGEEVGTPEVVASGARKKPAPTRGQTVKTKPPVEVSAEPKEGVASGVVVGQGGAKYVEQQ